MRLLQTLRAAPLFRAVETLRGLLLALAAKSHANQEEEISSKSLSVAPSLSLAPTTHTWRTPSVNTGGGTHPPKKRPTAERQKRKQHKLAEKEVVTFWK